MKQNSNIIKHPGERVRINIGTIIILFIFVYLFASFLYYAKKDRISMYEVVSQNLTKDLTVTGIITRDEETTLAEAGGFINYYIPEGSRVAKNATIYSVDANRAVYDLIGADLEVNYSENDLQELKRNISNYMNMYQNGDFSSVYRMKETLAIKNAELSDQKILEQIQTIVNTTGVSSAFLFVCAKDAGMISYFSDCYDGITLDEIDSGMWDLTKYTGNNLRTTDYISAGVPVYKSIRSNQWNITCLLTMEQYMTLQNKEKITFIIEEDGFQASANATFFSRGSDYYMNLSMDKYLANYLNTRFLTLNIVLSEKKGLKIPASSLTEEEFYLVPLDCLMNGGDMEESKTGINLVTYDAQTGEPFFEFREVEVFYETDVYAYIDMDEIPYGTNVLAKRVDEETKQVSDDVIPIVLTGKLEGVYCVNKGYAQFRRVVRVDGEENDTYVIIEADTKHGIRVLDHIALDAALITNKDLIY